MIEQQEKDALAAELAKEDEQTIAPKIAKGFYQTFIYPVKNGFIVEIGGEKSVAENIHALRKLITEAYEGMPEY